MTDLTKFRDLGISESILKALQKKGFENPSPIQEKTIPFLLENKKDLIGKAQTGTGKTAAFGIPLLQAISINQGNVQALILAPTRELAIQVADELESFSTDFNVKIMSIYGGQPIDRQMQKLKRGVDIVVGTPGRVLDHLKRKTLDLSKASHVILDEADEMLNMGFIEDIETILQSSPKDRRTVLFSATMPRNIEKLAKKYMQDYDVISVISQKNQRKNIEQIYFEVSQSDKFEALFRVIAAEESFYGLVFCRTKSDVDQVATKLINRGLKSDAIHGDLSQGQREKVLSKFRDKKINILVATDVAARGIDIDDLTHVVNHALPQDPESYVHRIGRTGRAGKTGTAITFITPSEYRKINTLQKIANVTIKKQNVPAIKDIIDKKKQRIIESVTKSVENAKFGELETLAKEILESNPDATKALASVLKMAFKNELQQSSYSQIRDPKKRRENSYDDRNSNRRFERTRNPRGHNDNKSSSGARLFIAKGRKDKMDPRALVNFIQKETGLDQRKIDDVRLFDEFSFFAVPNQDAQKVLSAFEKNARGKRSLVTRAKERR